MFDRYSQLLKQRNYLYLRVTLNAFVRVVGASLAFLLTIMISRKMGASQAGIYFYAIAIVMFLSTVVRLGTDSTIVRFTSQAHANQKFGEIKDVLHKAASITLIAGTTVALGLFFSAEYLESLLQLGIGSASTIRSISPAVLSVALLAIVAMSLQGIHRITASIIVLNVAMSGTMLACLLVFNLESPKELASTFSLVTLLIFIVALIWWRSLVPGQKENSIGWATFFSSCMPLWAAGIMIQATMWSSQLISGAYVNSADLAQLAVAQRCAFMVSFPLAAVAAVVTPRFSALYSKDQLPELKNLVKSCTKFLCLISFPLAAVCIYFSEYIISLFGPGFEGGVLPFKIMAISNLVNSISGPMGFLLMMSGNEKDFRKAVFLFSPATIIVELAVIPIYGILGAAIVASCSAILFNLYLVYRVKKLLGITII